MNLNVQTTDTKYIVNDNNSNENLIEQSIIIPLTIDDPEFQTLEKSNCCQQSSIAVKCPLVELNTNTDNNLDTQFSRSSVGGAKYLMTVHPTSPDSCDLVFESRFESGNLAKAVKITPVYYELYLRTDMYTNRHSQWFYFRVTNTRKGIPYRY